MPLRACKKEGFYYISLFYTHLPVFIEKFSGIELSLAFTVQLKKDAVAGNRDNFGLYQLSGLKGLFARQIFFEKSLKFVFLIIIHDMLLHLAVYSSSRSFYYIGQTIRIAIKIPSCYYETAFSRVA